MKKRLVIYFHYDPRGQADEACRFAVRAVLGQAQAVFFVTNGRLDAESRAWAQSAGVRLLERTNIVDVPAVVGSGVVDLAVCDVSFTSVITVLPAVMELLRPGGTFLTLVKPQFEAPREDVGEGGVVRDQAVREAALERVRSAFEQAGLMVRGTCESPITGHKGNVEYLLCGVCDR